MSELNKQIKAHLRISMTYNLMTLSFELCKNWISQWRKYIYRHDDQFSDLFQYHPCERFTLLDTLQALSNQLWTLSDSSDHTHTKMSAIAHTIVPIYTHPLNTQHIQYNMGLSHQSQPAMNANDHCSGLAVPAHHEPIFQFKLPICDWPVQLRNVATMHVLTEPEKVDNGSAFQR